MTGHYRRWNDPDAIEAFANKGVDDFFLSETRFVRRLGPEVRRVLDVGCAAGRFIELLAVCGARPAYTGIDLSADSIERGRACYPEARFMLGNALTLDPGGPFDLVNATGVCQHEPRFEALIRRMLGWSARHVLFDVKIAALDDHLADIDRAYCGREHRLYFILLSLPRLLSFLTGLPAVRTVEVFGYETPVNDRTVLPPDIQRVFSAGVLLQKGGDDAAASEVRVEVPPAAWPRPATRPDAGPSE